MFEVLETSEYLDLMKNVQKIIVKFLKDKDEQEEETRFLNLTQIKSVSSNAQIFKEMLHLISTLSSNYHRTPNFFQKIEKIIKYYKNQIQSLPNQQIFDIFKGSKRVLLFLFEEKILIPDSYIFNKIVKPKYSAKSYDCYFYPEFKSFFAPQFQQKFEKNFQDLELFNENRKSGENDTFLCRLIQKDSIEEFVATVNKNNYKLSMEIRPSIFETNSFLIGKKPSLIEYASFYGSIQIFQYLFLNKVKITSSILIYAVHGDNYEIIHKLEEFLNINKIEKEIENCLKESILCHHNKLAKYFLDNYIQITYNTPLYNEINYLYYSSYNYHFITFTIQLNDLFFLCKHDYLNYAYSLIIQESNDINKKYIDKKKNKPFNLKLPEKKCSLLNLGIKKGNCELVYFLLNIKNIDVNDVYLVLKNEKTIEKSNPSLNFAVECLNEKMVEILLSHPNINPNSKQIIKMNNIKLENSANIKYNLIKEKTPLHIAIKNVNQTMIDKLLSSGKINVNEKILSQKDYKYNYSSIKFDKVKTVLHVAAKIKDPIIINKLIENQIDLNQNLTCYINNNNCLIKNESALFIAAKNNNQKIVEILLNNEQTNLNQLITIPTNFDWFHFIINVEEKTVLHEVIEKGDQLLFQQLLMKKHIEINEVKTIKKLSNYYNEMKTIKNDSSFQILSQKSPLHVAIENKNLSFVQKLLANDKTNPFIKVILYDSSKIEKTTLAFAIGIGEFEIIKLLLSIQKLNVNEKTIIQNSNLYEESSPLHHAIKENKLEVVKMLLEHPLIEVNEKYVRKSIQKNQKIKKELTPLYLAVEYENLEIIQILLNANNELNANEESVLKQKQIDQNNKAPYKINRITALQHSIIKNNPSIVDYLIKRPKIDVNAKTVTISRINKLFNKAVLKKANEIDQKSDIYQKIKSQKTALTVAIEEKKEELVNILLKHNKI